ncbi:MAG TPA: hypothetical protein VF765_30310 [Polyangiaceae bacterium]
MPTWSRVRAPLVRLAWRIPWLCLYAVGSWLLFRPAMHVVGRHLSDLWVYTRTSEHRYTAMSMLTGSLTLHWSAGHAGHDEQIYNGAGYTNWGYGVPLLQLPFHAIARHMRSLAAVGFFPDRAIFFIYLALAIGAVWAGFDKLLASRERFGAGRRLRRHAVSWAATAFVLTTALYPLIASRFIIYEETVAYFVMVQLVACAAFVFAVDARAGAPAIVAFGAAVGIGLLVRPTGVVYLAVWAGVLLFERRSWRVAGVFAGAVAPFVLFWMVTNQVRGGAPWSLGFGNTLLGYDLHIPIERFGSLCADTRQHATQAGLRLFSAFFMLASDEPTDWMRRCHFDFEPHNGDIEYMSSTEPFFGLAVLLFLCWTVVHPLLRGERRVSTYVPQLAFTLLFLAYVRRGQGFAWRYIGDFWPLVILAGVQYVRRLPAGANAVFGWPAAFVLAAGAVGAFRHDVEPWKSIVKSIDPPEIPHMWDDFTNARYGTDGPMPSTIKCGQVPSWPWRNGRGWGSGCYVDTFSDVFVGVPRKDADDYVLQFKTEGIRADTVRVYVNGRIYKAHRVGDTFSTPVSLHYASFHSPIALTTIEWVRGFDPQGGKLLEVRLL